MIRNVGAALYENAIAGHHPLFVSFVVPHVILPGTFVYIRAYHDAWEAFLAPAKKCFTRGPWVTITMFYISESCWEKLRFRASVVDGLFLFWGVSCCAARICTGEAGAEPRDPP